MILHELQKANVIEKYIQLFETLCEILELLYSKEVKRTNESILRLYNVLFSCMQYSAMKCFRSLNLSQEESYLAHTSMLSHTMLRKYTELSH